MRIPTAAALALALLAPSSAACEATRPASAAALAPTAGEVRRHEVAGSGVHYFGSAMIHSSQPTATGVVQRSTETVELSGDLAGRLLYQPVTVIDLAKGTLVNTGHQVFSGTVLGSAPVLLHDDEFRFEVDLATGATTGEVHLVDRIAGPRIRCDLEVVGTGMTAAGDATFDYEGVCTVRWRAKSAPTTR